VGAGAAISAAISNKGAPKHTFRCPAPNPLLPPGEGGAIGRRETPVFRWAMAPDEGCGAGHEISTFGPRGLAATRREERHEIATAFAGASNDRLRPRIEDATRARAPRPRAITNPCGTLSWLARITAPRSIAWRRKGWMSWKGGEPVLQRSQREGRSLS
jgi:hypothetical protein